jgi:exopolysaccharide production protein ExoQ
MLATWFFAGAALLAFLVWGALGLSRWYSTTPKGSSARLSESLIWLIGLAPLVIGSFGPEASELEGTLVTQSEGAAGALGELSNILLLALLVFVIAIRLPKRLWPRWSPVLLGAVAFFAGVALASLFGSRPIIYRGAFLFPLALIALSYLPSPSAQRLQRQLCLIALTYVYSSLLLAIVWPDKVAITGYPSVLGLPSFRLVGLVQQGTILGPIAALALFALYASPSIKYRWVHAISAGLVLVLSQGKTAWIAFIVGALVIWAYRAPNANGRVARLSVAVLVLLLTVFQAFTPSGQDRLSDLSPSAQDFQTLNGRRLVWDATMDVWEQNRWFGYGPSLWDPTFRARYGEEFEFAGQAHNQFIQSLGEAGLVGLAGLLVYLACLMLSAWSGAVISRGFSLACLALIVVRLFTEAALRTYRLDASFALHLLLVHYVMVASDRGRVPSTMTTENVVPAERPELVSA